MEHDNDQASVSKFDRIVGSLNDGNGLRAKATTIETIQRVVGAAQTFIVQTIRDDKGDNVILKYLDNDGPIRLVLPPQVVNTIVRQRDALIARARSNSSKALAAERKAAGVVPGFMKKKQAAEK